MSAIIQNGLAYLEWNSWIFLVSTSKLIWKIKTDPVDIDWPLTTTNWSIGVYRLCIRNARILDGINVVMEYNNGHQENILKTLLYNSCRSPCQGRTVTSHQYPCSCRTPAHSSSPSTTWLLGRKLGTSAWWCAALIVVLWCELLQGVWRNTRVHFVVSNGVLAVSHTEALDQ